MTINIVIINVDVIVIVKSFYTDSPESVKREISIFFPDFNISKWHEENEEHFLNGSVKFIDDEFIHTVGARKTCMIQ